ncbi:inositol monophosphatase family protein [Demequina oxidasica]|uniref:inositol monophosphatase family protein n=1 Tax=Demequina oxidasica TaxID=676199 RepID=UPI00078177D6|nr:inositol monophosphatase family protein [Demequina oxidasica]
MQHANTVLEGVADLVHHALPEIERRRYSVHLKADNTPVTEADVYLETRIEDFLRAQLGEVDFVGEESYRERRQDDSGWRAVLDPIDGTENFTSGLKEWGVSLTLWRDGAHEASMLLLPELGERLITGDSIEKKNSRIVGFSSGMGDALVRRLSEAGQARITGCAVYNLFNVITGSFAQFINPIGAYSWDLLAGLSLALEHGCEVSLDGQPYHGEYLEPGRKYCISVRN